MFLIISALCLLSLITYWWYNVISTRYKLRWVKSVPGLPILGNVMDFQKPAAFLTAFDKYTKKYGRICRVEVFTLPFLLISDYKFIEFLLSSNKILSKTLEHSFLEKWLGTGLLTSTGSKWKLRRKMLTPAFHLSILEQFVENFDANGKILIELLERGNLDKPVDVHPFLNMCALDIICEAAMGISVNAQRNHQSDYVLSVQKICSIIVERASYVLSMNELTYPLTSYYYAEKKCLDILHSHTDAVIKAKQDEYKNKKNDKEQRVDEGLGAKKRLVFLDLLLQSTVDGKPLSKEDIREEVDTFMFGGHDTTSSGMSFVLYNIAKYPDIQDQIIEEQRMLFGSDRNRIALYRDLQEMKYLELVIKESLRLFPPVPIIGRTTDEDIEYEAGKIIPKGINNYIFIYAANRNPDYFENPEKFDPSRFETRNGKVPFSYIPFSAGPRNCIGQRFAMLEMKSVLSKVVRNFEIHPAGIDLEPVLATEVILRSLNGVNVILKKRHW